MELGPRLRAARTARNISVRALAQRTGFSPSFLSQVELGQSSPSLASLQRICDALEVELPDLLRGPGTEHTVPVVRRRDREAVRSEWSKATAESLTPSGSDERMTGLLLSLDPNGRTGSLPLRRGVRTLAYCVRGSVRLTLGTEHYELRGGDSAVIDQSPSLENRGRTKAEVVLVSARLAK